MESRMLTLDLPVEPYWLDLPRGVRVKIRPFTTAEMAAAQAASARYLGALRATETDLGPDMVRGLAFAFLVKALARHAFTALEGVGDTAGKHLPLSPEAVERLMDMNEMAAAFWDCLENRGQITVRDRGPVALAGPHVSNSGTIRANLGTVRIAGGAPGFTLDFAGDGLLSLDVTRAMRGGTGGAALVTNAGVIEAKGGTVTLSAHAASGLIEDLVQNTGTIGASRVRIAAQGGNVGLAAGRVAAPGGRVEVTANGGTVRIGVGARVITSGRAAGNVQLGGEETRRVEVAGRVAARGRGDSARGGTIALQPTGALTLGEAARVNAPRAVQGTPRAAFSDVVVDPGDVVRRALLVATDPEDGRLVLSLGTALATRLAGQRLRPADTDGPDLRFGEGLIRVVEVPYGPYARLDAAGYQILLAFDPLIRRWSVAAALEGP